MRKKLVTLKKIKTQGSRFIKLRHTLTVTRIHFRLKRPSFGVQPEKRDHTNDCTPDDGLVSRKYIRVTVKLCFNLVKQLP